MTTNTITPYAIVRADVITVKALRQHLNAAGVHMIDDEYVIDRRDGERLIARGLVEAVETAATPIAAPENKRRAKAPSAKA